MRTKEALGLKHVSGQWKFGDLVRLAFTGIQCQLNNPYYQVRVQNGRAHQILGHMHIVSVSQYLHPWKSEEYREAARALRRVGEECIRKRMTAVKNGEEVPNDILSTILQVASKL